MSALVSGSLKTDSQLVVVILAGGQGTRFWPMSRTAKPKQFLPLSAHSDKTLIQQTVIRTSELGIKTSVLVVTAESQVALVKEQVPEAAILAEPVAKNTAASLAFAAEFVKSQVGDVPMLCLPSDHVIENLSAMKSVFLQGIELARTENVLVTFGIAPTHPETGFGYIQRGASLDRADCYKVKAFVEKPNKEKAKEYLDARTYLWNSGMFVWRPSVFLGELSTYMPKTAQALASLSASFGSKEIDTLVRSQFANLDSISIDYGVLEKAQNVVVVAAADFGWSDVGSWDAWAEHVAKSGSLDTSEAVQRGDVFIKDCPGSAVFAQSRFVAAIGLENVVIVETPDAVLVCSREKSQDVKAIVDFLKQTKRETLL